MKKVLLVFLVFIVLIGCKTGNNASLAYAPIRFEETAASFIEKDGALNEEDFQDLSNSVRVLHNCGLVPYSRIESVKDITEDEYIRDSSSFLIHAYEVQCAYGNDCFTVTFYKEKEVDTPRYGSLLILSRVTGENFDYVRGRIASDKTSRECISSLIEIERQRSLTLLEEHCSITEEEAIRLMEEFDLLDNEEVIDLYEIASIEQAERVKNSISLSLTSNSGTHYKVVINTVNRPIILSITDSDGQVLYESEER